MGSEKHGAVPHAKLCCALGTGITIKTPKVVHLVLVTTRRC